MKPWLLITVVVTFIAFMDVGGLLPEWIKVTGWFVSAALSLYIYLVEVAFFKFLQRPHD